jgi:hypothetical protein
MEAEKDIAKVVTNLYKQMLFILEDLQEEHRAVYGRLLDNSPEEMKPLIAQADYFDDRKMNWLRKRVLDIGNDAVRETQQRFEIHFKFKENN